MSGDATTMEMEQQPVAGKAVERIISMFLIQEE